MKKTLCLAFFFFFLAFHASAQKRLVLIDEDGSGPGGSDQMGMMALLQSPKTEVLGITIVTGDAWRDEEVQHTLRMLELIGRTDVPVVPGAVFPLIRSQEETQLFSQIAGKSTWLGAWGEGLTTAQPNVHDPYKVPPLPEGPPETKPLDEDAAHFLIRQVRAHPREVTIYAAGPLTDIAQAISINPHFAELTQGIVIMGGSVDPISDDHEISASPTHEFNFWFDPEAAHIVLRADWPRVDVTTADVSMKAPLTRAMLAEISKSPSPAAQYIARYSRAEYYLWDELTACAWLDPSIITKENMVYMDVDLSHGINYGNTLVWTGQLKPATGVRQVHAQMDVDLPKFTRMFVELMSGSEQRKAGGRR